MITYSDSTENLSADQLEGFFAGWPNPPSAKMHLKILQQSDHLLLAIDQESDQVVGFVTAITDGVLSAYIPLLEVLEPYQHMGIGTELVRRMLDKLSGLYMIDLLCDLELQHFYERFEFKPSFAMRIRNYQVLAKKS